MAEVVPLVADDDDGVIVASDDDALYVTVYCHHSRDTLGFRDLKAWPTTPLRKMIGIYAREMDLDANKLVLMYGSHSFTLQSVFTVGDVGLSPGSDNSNMYCITNNDVDDEGKGEGVITMADEAGAGGHPTAAADVPPSGVDDDDDIYIDVLVLYHDKQLDKIFKARPTTPLRKMIGIYARETDLDANKLVLMYGSHSFTLQSVFTVGDVGLSPGRVACMYCITKKDNNLMSDKSMPLAGSEEPTSLLFKRVGRGRIHHVGVIIGSKTLTMESTLHDAMMEVNAHDDDDSLFVSATGILLELYSGGGGGPIPLTVIGAKKYKLKELLDLTSGVNQFVVEVKSKPEIDKREKEVCF